MAAVAQRTVTTPDGRTLAIEEAGDQASSAPARGSQPEYPA